ncbi:MAG TPA: hypothetical protein VM124_03195 [Candidatus Limnocylindrales bacterium]|nr:hypothetical protein [Candidatus Limnocylindrales bacterium]
MKGTAFLISGFELNRTAADGQYSELRNAIASKGYEVMPVDIKWNYHTMSRFVSEFKAFYLNKASKHNVIIGNSFGAMAAMITAPELKPDKIILCSLSPFFQEDIPRFQPPEKLTNWFGRRRVEDFSTISATATANKINRANTKSILFYGEQEKKKHKKLVDRVISTAHDLKGSQLIEIPGTPHSFRDPRYVIAISKVL